MIGVYDSGIGGLAVLSRLRRRFPHADLVYFGDTAHLPYGNKPVAALRRYADGALSFLASEGVSALLIACGTVSTTLLERGLLRSDLPAVGVVSPAIDEVAGLAPRRIAVLATRASCNTGVFAARLSARIRDAEILELACPALVPLIEAGKTDAQDDALLALLRRELAPCVAFSPDAILLGCTHYVLLERALRRLFPRALIVDCGTAAVQALAPHLGRGRGQTRYFVSGDPALFCAAARTIEEIPAERIKRIRICQH